MRKFTWLLALAIPVTIISCQKDAVHEASNEDAALIQGQAVTGNGAPSGKHYNLNIIAVPKGKTAPMDGNTGGRIFVPEDGAVKIWLHEGSEFQVTDANGTDRDGASFVLPDPLAGYSEDGSVAYTKYSVFARVPSNNPKGAATLKTCAEGMVVYNNTTGTTQEVEVELVCDDITFDDNKTFQNVSAELLFVTILETVSADIDGDGDLDTLKAGRYPIFDDRLYGFFWEYDANKMKILQLRFYDISSTVDVTPDENGNYDPTITN